MKKLIAGILATILTASAGLGVMLTAAAAETETEAHDFNSAQVYPVASMEYGDTKCEVKATDGCLSVKAGTADAVVTKVLNTSEFTATEDVSVEYDYTRKDCSWSDDQVWIGAKGGENRQWGSMVLRFSNVGGGLSCAAQLMNDGISSVLATGGTAPLESAKVYHIRITVVRATGTINVFITPAGAAESSNPTLTYTNNTVKALSGGIALKTWAGEFTVDNLKINAGERVLVNTDFSSTGVVSFLTENGAAAAFQNNAVVLTANMTGGYVITDKLLDKASYKLTEVTLDYTPKSTVWNIDQLLLGYKNGGSDAGIINVVFTGTDGGTKNTSVSIVTRGETTTELAKKDFPLTDGKQYHVKAQLDREAGKIALTVWSDGAEPSEPTLTAESDIIKTLEGTVGASSFGGLYELDNLAVSFVSGSAVKPEEKPENKLEIKKATFDFNNSLGAVNVKKAVGDTKCDVKLDGGRMLVMASSASDVYSDKLCDSDFAEGQSIDLAFDYFAAVRSESDDRICIGAKGGDSKQWGSIILTFPNLSAGTHTVEWKNEGLDKVLASGGTAPLESNTTYRIRVVINQSAGSMKVYVNKKGSAEALVLDTTNDLLKRVSGGVVFSTWFNSMYIDNLTVAADGEKILDTDFSGAEAKDVTLATGHTGTAKLSGGKLVMNGYNPSTNAGDDAFSLGLFNQTDLQITGISFDYASTSLTWSDDEVILGSKADGVKGGHVCLALKNDLANGQKLLAISYDGTDLAAVKVNASTGTVYRFDFEANHETGEAKLWFYPAASAKPAEPSLTATNDVMKEIIGDVTFCSWGGKYTADNVNVSYVGSWTSESVLSPVTENVPESISPTGDSRSPVTATVLLCVSLTAAVFCFITRRKEESL